MSKRDSGLWKKRVQRTVYGVLYTLVLPICTTKKANKTRKRRKIIIENAVHSFITLFEHFLCPPLIIHSPDGDE